MAVAPRFQTPQTPVVPRSRVRPVQPVANSVEAPASTDAANSNDVLQRILSAYHLANSASNAHKRAADAQKRDLHKAMIAAGTKDASARVTMPDGTVELVEAKIDAPEEEIISVARLRTLVDDETFMKIVSATKTAVTAHAGTNIVLKATVTVEGKEDLRIKKVRS